MIRADDSLVRGMATCGRDKEALRLVPEAGKLRYANPRSIRWHRGIDGGRSQAGTISDRNWAALFLGLASKSDLEERNRGHSMP